MQHRITVKDIDDILPQTQCGLCSYGGCNPYATAIVEKNEKINRCPPGGITGLLKLAKITGQDATPYLEEIKAQEKPRKTAVIREEECIGCTKCISACPVDAILGASKYMHTVITDECTGCELCVAPCPVDCIDMLDLGPPEYDVKKAQHYKMRFENKNARLAKEKTKLERKYKLAKVAFKEVNSQRETVEARKKAIAEAVERRKSRNN